MVWLSDRQGVYHQRVSEDGSRCGVVIYIQNYITILTDKQSVNVSAIGNVRLTLSRGYSELLNYLFNIKLCIYSL